MAQLTIYLPDEIEARARKAATAQNTSVSKWISERVVGALDNSWPKAVLDAAGACVDFPELDDIRTGLGVDSRRESFD